MEVTVKTPCADNSTPNQLEQPVDSVVKSGKFLVQKYLDEISDKDASTGVRLLAHWVFKTFQPFNSVSAPSFKRFIGFLRPSFLKFLPCANTLSTTLLNEAYETLQKDVLQRIREQNSFSIVSDTWTSINQRHLANILIVTPLERPIFLKSVDVSGESITSQFVFDMIKDVAADLGTEKWLSFVSDSAANMAGSWKLIEKNFPKVFAHGCAPHSLNNFFKDLMKKVAGFGDIMERSLKIVKFIMYHDYVLSRFREIQGSRQSCKTLKFPCETRFSSYFTCFESVLVNRLFILQLFDNYNEEFTMKKIDGLAGAQSIAEDNLYWTQLRFITYDLMKPVAEAITKLEGDTAHVGTVYNVFLTLRNHFETVKFNYSVIDRDTLINMFVQRWSLFHAHTMGMAHILNPQTVMEPMFKDDEFDDYADSIDAVKTYIKHYYCDDKSKDKAGQDEFAKYLRQVSYLSEEGKNELRESDPRDYWAVQGRLKFPTLSPLASRLFVIPSSNCSSERNWKVFSNTLTKTRNRLSGEKAEKLVFYQVNAHMLDEEDESDYFD